MKQGGEHGTKCSIATARLVVFLEKSWYLSLVTTGNSDVAPCHLW